MAEQQPKVLCNPITRAPQVDLIGHSAGGWLGRAFIGQAQYKGSVDSSDDEPHEAVRSIITLGTPHTPPPADKVLMSYLLSM